MTDLEALAEQMISAPRPALLQFLAAVINSLTIVARASYDEPDGARMMRVNEAIHRVSGHLRDLSSPIERLTRSRARKRARTPRK